MIQSHRARTRPRTAISIPRIARLLAVAALAVPAVYALPSAHAATTGLIRDNGTKIGAGTPAIVKPSVFVPDGDIIYVNGTTGSDVAGCGLTAAAACKSISYTIANIAGPGDVISIAAGTYAEVVTLSYNVELLGAGTATVPPSAPTTIINGTGLGCSVVTVNKGVSAVLSLVAITGGSGTLGNVPCTVAPTAAVNIFGGGILNFGTLTVTNSAVTGNTTGSTNTFAAEGVGGGIYNAAGATLTVSSSTISGNTAGNGTSTTSGGFDNGGGGIANFGTATVDESTISGNTVPGETAIAGENSLGGGILNEGTLTLTSSTVSGNTVTATTSGTAFGGGIENDAGRTATIANSTITGNTATGATGASSSGGGLRINTFSTVTLINDTITSNSAVASGATPGTATGGGVDNPQAVANTIFALNTKAVGTPPAVTSSDCGALIGTNNGGNLADDATCTGIATAGVASIGALANNGGETMTQALLAGSPAIGAGLAATCEAAPINDLDQRGLPRYAVIRGVCDSGAYDTGGGIVPPITTTGAIPLTTGVPARLGFAASNHGFFIANGVLGLQSFTLSYITFQKGANTFVVRGIESITCTSAIVAANHCVGTTGVIQGVTQFVAVPGGATLTLSGDISSGRGAYLVGQDATVTLSITASATGKITVNSVTVAVEGVTQATWVAPLPFGTNIQFDTSSPLIF